MAGHIDHVIPWHVQFSLRAGFCRPFSSPPALPLGLLGFFSTDAFVSVTGACSFPLVWGLMAGLRCCASHEGIISILGLAANSGSTWILQAPNLHFSDAVVNNRYHPYLHQSTSSKHPANSETQNNTTFNLQ